MQNIKYISMKAVLIQTSQDTMHMQYMGNVPWMLLRSTRLPEQLFCHPSGLTAVWYILRTKFRQGRDLLSIFATIQSRFEPYWKNVVKNEILSQKEESPCCCWTTWGCKSGLKNNKYERLQRVVPHIWNLLNNPGWNPSPVRRMEINVPFFRESRFRQKWNHIFPKPL